MRVSLVTTWDQPCGIAREFLAARIQVHETGCWLWTGTVGFWGYGQLRHRGKTYRAHRVVYAAVRGSVPPLLDHLCRNKLCVNPDHLEGVSSRVNTLRGVGRAAENARKTVCRRGHPLTDANVRRTKGKYGWLRTCRTCQMEQAKARYALFTHFHAPQTREAHWQGKKDPACEDCRRFTEEVRREGIAR